MILVHHLRIGRSIFTVWLLEELGLDYELKIYDRNQIGRAPPELKAAHPLGKSPVIVDDGVTLAESGAIGWHLVERYGAASQLAPPPLEQKAARMAWLQWLHYPEASGFAPLLLKLLLSREQEPKPPLISFFAAGEVALQLGYVQDALGEHEFITGSHLSLPDIGLTYLMHMAERLGELSPYPKLEAYRARNMARPAFARALARTGG